MNRLFSSFIAVLFAALAFHTTAKAGLLDAGPTIYEGNGPSARWGGGGFGGYVIGIGVWPVDFGTNPYYDKAGRLYLGFSQPFTSSSGVNFAIESGGGPVELFFYYNYSLITSFLDDLDQGINFYDVDLGSSMANNVVVVNRGTRGGWGTGDISFTDAGIASLTSGSGAPSWDANHPQNIGYAIPEPSTYALLLMTGAGALWFTRKRRPIKVRLLIPVIAVLFAAFTLNTQPSAKADTFGTSGNEFTIDFVSIGNAGNAADTTGYGAVPYAYRIGTYEITHDAITKATASGLSNVTADGSFTTGNQPAADISWYEAAAFVNWLNTSTGNQAAYDLTFSGGSWGMTLWSGADAWTAGGTNLYRNKNAFYFLPSENEWYKTAYYNPAGLNYFLYPTASSSVPTAVASGTTAGSAVYGNFGASRPAIVNSAGSLSPYGTMGQGGNQMERIESAFDGTNNSAGEDRVFRGGNHNNSESFLRSSSRLAGDPTSEGGLQVGFRVASVPEPSSYALLLMTAAGALWWARRRR